MSDLASRLRDARTRAGFPSARSAAMRFGWRPSTYAAHENGQNSFDAGQALIYAKAFKAEVGWLFFGNVKYNLESGGYIYNPSGFIYNTGLVSMSIKSWQDQIPAYSFFTPMPNDIKVFQFMDDSLWPQYNKNDLLICRSIEQIEGHELLGSEAVVELEDGQVILRQIEISKEPQTFNLISQKHPMIRSVSLKQAWIKLATVSRPGYGFAFEAVERGKFPRLEDSPFVAAEARARADSKHE